MSSQNLFLKGYTLCRITISRFYRDKEVFAALEQVALPSLLREARERGDTSLRIWSAGCGSGEEPYTLAVLCDLKLQKQFPELTVDIVATDADPNVIRRALVASYRFGSLKDLPESWGDRILIQEDASYHLKPEYRRNIEFLEQDIRRVQPEGPLDLVLCRNLVFTYFDDALQLAVLNRIVDTMRDGAALVIGVHETLPKGPDGLQVWLDKQRIYQKTAVRSTNSVRD
jgi:chemotaxis protein methyltransferase CheR